MTSKKEVLEKINQLLKELTSKYEEISDNEKISPLEIELFEINAFYFAEHTKILRKLTERELQADSSEESVEEPTVAFETNVSPTSEQNEMEVNDFYSVEDDAGEVQLDVEKQSGESASNSEEGFKGGKMETEVRVENNKIVAEEDEIVLEEPNVTESFHSLEKQPEVAVEQKQTTDFSQEVVIEEREFSVKVEREEVAAQEEFTSIRASQVASAHVQPPSSVSRSLTESYSDSKPQSLNDRISALRQQNMPEGSNKPLGSFQQIKDIKSIINLNDKLMFIKDLFNGYSLAYSEAIELLNRYETFDQADAFLQNNYSEKNSWSSKKETVDKLYVILRKRYS